MSLFIPPNARATDANSDSLSGAGWYFYTTGTLTPATVYTTVARNVAHEHPVEADAGGKFPSIYLDPEIVYRAIQKDSAGTSIFDIDPYQSADSELRADLTQAEAAIDSLNEQVAAIASDLSAVATAGSDYDGISPLVVLASDSTANLADPDIADVAGGSDLGTAIGTTTANQKWRVRNNTTGVLAAANSATLGSFGVTRKLDVTAGSTYTYHLHNCPLGWYIYSASSAQLRVQFFNTDGSFHSEITSGFTVDVAATPRQVTFTVPSGAEKVAFNLRNTDQFSNTNPITTAAMQVVQDNQMLALGSSAVDFVPYNTDLYTMDATRFDAETANAPIKVSRQGEYCYFRAACQQHPTKDVVWRFRAFHGLGYFRVLSRSGVLDPSGIRFIDRTAASTISAYNRSTDFHAAGTDEAPADRRNSVFLDGNHGIYTYQVTKTAHGMTNVDVGSLWTDTAADVWMLKYIESVDKLTFERRYTGTDTKWVILSSAPTGTTFTHQSGATHTGDIAFTAPTQVLFVPSIAEYTCRLMIDDTEITADGDYSGTNVWIEEGFVGLNPAKVQDALVAAVGADPPNYTPDLPQVRTYYRYEFDNYGAMTIYAGKFDVEEFTRTASIDYTPVMQLQRLSITTDTPAGQYTSVELCIPDVGTVSGFTWKNKVSLASVSTEFNLRAQDCDDPDDPSSLFVLLGKSGSTYLAGSAFGLDPTVELGIPSRRASSADYLYTLSTADKSYVKMIDYLAGDGAADATYMAVGFRAPFLNTDATLTVPGVIYHCEGQARCIVVAHQTHTAKDIPIPDELSGLRVTILRGDGLTLDNGFVRDGNITISVPGSFGWAVLGLG